MIAMETIVGETTAASLFHLYEEIWKGSGLWHWVGWGVICGGSEWERSTTGAGNKGYIVCREFKSNIKPIKSLCFLLLPCTRNSKKSNRYVTNICFLPHEGHQ